MWKRQVMIMKANVCFQRQNDFPLNCLSLSSKCLFDRGWRSALDSPVKFVLWVINKPTKQAFDGGDDAIYLKDATRKGHVAMWSTLVVASRVCAHILWSTFNVIWNLDCSQGLLSWSGRNGKLLVSFYFSLTRTMLLPRIVGQWFLSDAYSTSCGS